MTPDARPFVISATVVTENEQHASRAAEVLARAAAGLLLGLPAMTGPPQSPNRIRRVR